MQKQENQHNSDSLQKRSEEEVIQPKQLKLALLTQIPVLSPLIHTRGLHYKYGGSDWSQKQPMSGSITKEEEEAVETLYTLVGIFPDNDKTDNKSELVGESSESKLNLFKIYVLFDDICTHFMAYALIISLIYWTMEMWKQWVSLHLDNMKSNDTMKNSLSKEETYLKCNAK
ncbi:hypothetical protein PVL29_006507 [Vitis rotundifolia]|uniref:Uncharacterized protein n=1 Tax=Vitis rotundifolia TaxID=103349 RepID=A0AA39A5F8_VITRO|nr:hypothetical protein PVL29_006507 [Vitis rotundifolia]